MAINTSTLTLTTKRQSTRPLLRLFNLSALLAFTILAVAAIGYRRRPEVHKRLMLFANITLMQASIAHLFGQIPGTLLSPPALLAGIVILNILFLLAPIVGDYLTEKRIRFLTATTAIGLFAFQVVVAVVIAPSTAWHRFAEWVSQ